MNAMNEMPAPLNFTDAGQKQQQGTGFLAQQLSRGNGDGLVKTLMGGKRLIAAFNRKRPPL